VQRLLDNPQKEITYKNSLSFLYPFLFFYLFAKKIKPAISSSFTQKITQAQQRWRYFLLLLL
jgi:hypothetical protein